MEEKIRKRHRKMEGILMGVGNRLNTYSPDTPPYVVLCSFPTRGQAVPSEFNFISPLTVLVAVTPSALPINQISHASIKSVMRQSNQSCVNQISYASIKSVTRQSKQLCNNQSRYVTINQSSQYNKRFFIQWRNSLFIIFLFKKMKVIYHHNVVIQNIFLSLFHFIAY